MVRNQRKTAALFIAFALAFGLATPTAMADPTTPTANPPVGALPSQVLSVRSHGFDVDDADGWVMKTASANFTTAPEVTSDGWLHYRPSAAANVIDENSPMIADGEISYKWRTDAVTVANEGALIHSFGALVRYIDENNYLHLQFVNKKFVLEWKNNGQAAWLENLPAPSLQANTEHEVVMRFEGATVRFSLDGQYLGELTDARIPTAAGQMGFRNHNNYTKDVYVSDVAYGPLTHGTVDYVRSYAKDATQALDGFAGAQVSPLGAMVTSAGRLLDSGSTPAIQQGVSFTFHPEADQTAVTALLRYQGPNDYSQVMLMSNPEGTIDVIPGVTSNYQSHRAPVITTTSPAFVPGTPSQIEVAFINGDLWVWKDGVQIAAMALSSVAPVPMTAGTYGFDGGSVLDNVVYTIYNAPVSFAVVYDANGAVWPGSAPAAHTVAQGSPVTLTGDTPTCATGSAFTEWNTAADGTGDSYAAGATFTPTINITLYAICAPSAVNPVVGTFPTKVLSVRSHGFDFSGSEIYPSQWQMKTPTASFTSSPSLTIDDKYLTYRTSAAANVVDRTSPMVADGEVSFKWKTDTGTTSSGDGAIQAFGPLVRYVDEDNYLHLELVDNVFVLEWKNNGQAAWSAELPAPSVQPDTVHEAVMRFEGTTVQFSMDGQYLGELTDSRIPTAAGQVGFRNHNYYTKTVWIDDVAYGPLRPSADPDYVRSFSRSMGPAFTYDGFSGRSGKRLYTSMTTPAGDDTDSKATRATQQGVRYTFQPLENALETQVLVRYQNANNYGRVSLANADDGTVSVTVTGMKNGVPLTPVTIPTTSPAFVAGTLANPNTGAVAHLNPSQIEVGVVNGDLWVWRDGVLIASANLSGESALPSAAGTYGFTGVQTVQNLVYSVYDAPPVFSVSYDVNGATWPGAAPANHANIAAGSSVALTDVEPTCSSWQEEFSGWNTKADGTGDGYASSAEFTPTKDTTLYAQCEMWVAYLENLPEQMTDRRVIPTLPTTATAVWADDSKTTVSVTWDAITRDQVENAGSFEVYGTTGSDKYGDVSIIVTVKPSWFVSYDPNGASWSGDAPAGHGPVVPGSAATLTDVVPTCSTGKNFAGWSTKADGTGTVLASSAQFTPTADTTLYAQCVASMVSVKPVAGVETGRRVLPSLPSTVVVVMSDGSEMSVPVTWDTVSAGQVEDAGSFTVSGSTGLEGDLATVSVTVTVKNSFFVSYDANGATWSGDAPEDHENVVPGSSITLSEKVPTCEAGTAFTEWNTLADGKGIGYESSATVLPTADTTLFAQCVAWVVSVKDVAGVETGRRVLPSLPSTVTVVMSDGSEASVPVTWDAVSAGQVEDAGSFTVSGSTGLEGDLASVSVTVTVKNSFFVSYDANGATWSGDAPPDHSRIVPGSSVTLSGKTPVCASGLMFREWNTLADGKGTGYQPGASVTPAGDVALYAVCVADSNAPLGGRVVTTVWTAGLASVVLVLGVLVGSGVFLRRRLGEITG